MIYFAIFALASLFAVLLQSTPAVGRIFYPVLLLIFFLLTAFRFEVGCDWSGYFYQFVSGRSALGADLESVLNDPLWWGLIDAVKWSNFSYPWLNVASAILFFLGIHALARRQSDRFAFLVLLWPVLILNIGMSGIRQAAAIGVMCFAYNAFADRRVVLFGLLVVLAATLHSSAMIFILLLPLVRGEYSRNRLALSAILAVPGMVLLAGSEAGEIAITRYVDSGIDAAGAVARVGLLALSGLFFFSVLRRPWMLHENKDLKLVQMGALAMIAILAVLPFSSVIADRLAYYLAPLQAAIFARIPFLSIEKSPRLYAVLPYLVLGAALLIWTMYSWHFKQCYLPYQSWLFEKPQSRLGIYF